MSPLFRSLVFVPGNNPRFLEKARGIDADIVCLDLEDSVPDAEKAAARRMTGSALGSRAGFASRVFVRTNSPASGRIPDDLAAVVQKGLDGLVIPKVDSAADLGRIEALLPPLEEAAGTGRLALIPSIESAGGVVNAYQIASSGPRVQALVFGVFDLLADLGVEYDKGAPGAGYPRAKIPVDARAAGVAAIDAIWQDLGDPEGLEADCRAGRALGYAGKSVIHPGQLPAVHRLFHPTEAEAAWARRVCTEYERSAAGGRGATTVDGRMIDEVHYRQARALLDLAGGR